MDGLNSNIEDKYVSNSTGYDYTACIDPANEKIFWSEGIMDVKTISTR
jgi:hypothetical protein